MRVTVIFKTCDIIIPRPRITKNELSEMGAISDQKLHYNYNYNYNYTNFRVRVRGEDYDPLRSILFFSKMS